MISDKKVEPFSPLDQQTNWEIGSFASLVQGYEVIFGAGSRYEAYLFCLVARHVGRHGVLGAGCNEQEVEDLVRSTASRVMLLLSNNCCRNSGAGLLQRIREGKPDTKAILLVNSLEMFQMYREELLAFDGVVSASSVGRGGILSCLKAMCSEERYVDQILQEIPRDEEGCHWSQLSQREREILPLLVRGLKNKEIAAELLIAETTTRDYVSSILRKLEVGNRAAAVAWAVKHGFAGT